MSKTAYDEKQAKSSGRMSAWKTASGKERNPVDHMQIFSIEIEVGPVVVGNRCFDKLYDEGARQVGEEEGFG